MLRTNVATHLLVACFLGVLAVPVGAITTTPSWKPVEVAYNLPDASATYGADRMLAYDHHGNPGIAHIDTINLSLDYARRVPGVGWHNVEVDPNGGNFPSLAFDRYERPAISYSQSSSSGLGFAHFDGTNWQVETADATDGSWTSLAFDILGHAAIAYTSDFPFSMKYVRDTDGDFSFIDETPVTVASVDNEGAFSSLAFDPLNRPMIAHMAVDTNELRFSVEEPGIGWITTTVDTHTPSPTYGAFIPSLAIDPDTNYPAIAYGGGSTGLRYAAWNGVNWDLTTVDSSGTDVGTFSSLAFDPADGHPAISYNSEQTPDELRFAWHDGSIWQTQTVDSGGDIFQSSLAFNDFGNGFASIAYVGGSSFDLNFIEDPPAVPEPASALLMIFGLASTCLCRSRQTTA